MNILKLYTDNFLRKRYRKAGLIYGEAISYAFLGKCLGYDAIRDRFIKLEKEWVRRGFKKISKDDWVSAGGYGSVDIDSLLDKAMGE